MAEDYLSFLNEKQLQAVCKPQQPVLVLAGPGTGKTRLLVSRIAWLISHENIQPIKILALTFTNKAASEMKSRLMNLIGQKGLDIFCGTFHSFSLRMLRRYHSHLALDKFFSVCDQDYQRSLIRHLCAPYIKDTIDAKVKGILLSFTNHVIKGSKLPLFSKDRFKEYNDYLKKHNLIDFDQIIVLCRNLLRDFDDILSEYQFLYQAILVDEFQDTDAVQYEIIKFLAQNHRNIFVVADDDQSIYSWRGANPENIKQFMKDFSIEDPLFLDINYRSGNRIIQSANRIIKQTSRIIPNKNIQIYSEWEDKIELQLFLNEQDELDFILNKIKTWIDQGNDYKDIGIIYPYHKIGQSLEQFIIKQNIPYQMAEGRSLLDHPIVKKIILYFRLIRDPEDNIALEELTLNELGMSIFSFIKQYADNHSYTFRKSLYEVYRSQDRRINLDMRLKIQNFIAHVANLVNLKSFFYFSQLINEISSLSERETYSFLNRHVTNLQDPVKINGIINYDPAILDEKQLYIHHHNEQICYLAGALVKCILNRSTKSINDRESNTIDGAILELEESYHEGLKMVKIPIYNLSNARRKGSLSNLFKFLQFISSYKNKKIFNRFIVLDLETTDSDAETCGIVEIAAVKVEDGQIGEKLQTLIKPDKAISKAAQDIHHISTEKVRSAPKIEEFWPKLKTFLDGYIIVAHNGYNFDFIILDRFARKIEGKKLSNIRFDSLALARTLFPNQSNSIDSLINRFNLKCTKRHRAMDDVHILVEIFDRLQELRDSVSRKTSFEMFIDIVALGNFIENEFTASEDRIFFLAGARKLLTPYVNSRTEYAKRFHINEAKLISDINQKLSRFKSDLSDYRNDEYIMAQIQSISKQYDQLTSDEAIANFLSYISLHTAQDELQDINAVSLLTYHAAKGLEFNKVILMGLEQDSMPGFHATREGVDDDRPIAQKVEEQRRLFYVGITRAKTELILTAVKNRGGWEHKSSTFLKDLDIPYIVASTP